MGIASIASVGAPVALVLNVDTDPPRFIEGIDKIELAGAAIPVLPFDVRAPSAALRAEYALALHGLPNAGTD